MSDLPRLGDMNALRRATILGSAYTRLRALRGLIASGPADIDKELRLLAEGALIVAVLVRAEILERVQEYVATSLETVQTRLRAEQTDRVILDRISLYLHGYTRGHAHRAQQRRALDASQLAAALAALLSNVDVSPAEDDRRVLLHSFGRGYHAGFAGADPFTVSSDHPVPDAS